MGGGTYNPSYGRYNLCYKLRSKCHTGANQLVCGAAIQVVVGPGPRAVDRLPLGAGRGRRPWAAGRGRMSGLLAST